MRKGGAEKSQRNKLKKIGELALRAFFNSFPSRRRIKFTPQAFEVILVSKKEMALLKKNKDKHADVLAFEEPKIFPLPLSLKTKTSLGEIYLNRDFKPRDFERLAFLFLHGLVHLLGFSHKKERDMIEMEKIEKKIWRQICFWV